MKRFLRFIFCVILGMCTLGFAASAADIVAFGDCDDGLKWTLDTNGTMTVSGKGEMYDAFKEGNYGWEYPWEKYRDKVKHLVFDKDVTSIASMAFQNFDKLETLELGNVTHIGDFAFYYCTALKRLDLANVITTEYGAFSRCEGLEEVYISASVENLVVWSSETPFEGCPSLREFTVDPNNMKYCSVDGVLFSKDMSILIHYPAKKTLTHYDVPEIVEYIGGHAFAECKSLVYVNTGDIIGISDVAFEKCTALETVYIPSVSGGFGEAVFGGCSPELTVYSTENGIAEKYANEYSIKFASVNDASMKVGITVANFPITINGIRISNAGAIYPCIIYNSITYFPMTYFGSRSLGLSADYTAETGLVINKVGTAPFGYDFEQGTSDNNSGELYATTAQGKITVNGKSIRNVTEKYPLLLFRDITYFPLTWRFAVEEFGWQYAYTNATGLVISCN